MTYNPCKRSDCPHPGELTPENPDKLVGPELGELVVYQDPRYERWHNTVMRVTARSYVWSPEVHWPSGYHGTRRYDWTVVAGAKGSMVVDDVKLIPLELGMKVELS